jgi:hypothetical protein
VFYLLESWHGSSYQDIMAMPTTRRYRMLIRKSDLEKKREADHRAAISRMRARR